MTRHPLPSPDLLRKLLRYDPETGLLFWRERPSDMFPGTTPGGQKAEAARWNNRLAGKPAFRNLRGKGYMSGTIEPNCMSTHRVVWAMHHNKWPSDQIDHINGDKLDNRIENLRDVDTTTNCQNRSKRSDNTSGHPGVIWHKQNRHWRATITVRGTKLYLGGFPEREDAIRARKAAEIAHGFNLGHRRSQ